MLRSVALSTGKWATRKSAYAGVIAAVAWFAVDLFDGAHHRASTRFTQAKDVVVTPAVQGWEWSYGIASKMWEGIENNPAPSIAGLIFFILTVVYHKVHGANLKASVMATLTRTMPQPVITETNTKPTIIQKAEADILHAHLAVLETELTASVTNLPDQIKEAEETAASMEREARRAEEQANTKRLRADSLARQLNELRQRLENAKEQLGQVRIQLNRTDEY